MVLLFFFPQSLAKWCMQIESFLKKISGEAFLQSGPIAFPAANFTDLVPLAGQSVPSGLQWKNYLQECLTSPWTGPEIESKFMNPLFVGRFQTAKLLSDSFSNSIFYLENILYEALVEVVGKHVEQQDLEHFMDCQNRARGTVSPFAFAVRRDTDDADGVVELCDTRTNDPIDTFCSDDGIIPTHMQIDASTLLKLNCQTHLHGFMLQKFGDCSHRALSLHVRAKQFSSFVVCLGTFISDKFDLKHALIVRNRDEVSIPLDAFLISSAQEFADAVNSLSPEQKNFCESFRQMQLAGI